jgi:hypothetical protein
MLVMLGSAVGFLSSIVSLSGQINWLRERGRGAGSFPEPTTQGRLYFYSLMGWVWTGQHRQIGHSATTRAVVLARAFMVIFPASMALLGWLGGFQ